MHLLTRLLKPNISLNLFKRQLVHNEVHDLCRFTWKPTYHFSSLQQWKRNLKHDNINKQAKRNFTEDRETKALTVWGSIKHLKHSPLPALALGASGLIPFVAAPSYMILCGTFMPSICTAQMTYGASILSFLGGVKWGFSIAEESILRPDWINLGVSVLPSLVAWAGLMCPHPISLFVMIGGLASVGYYDMVTWGYPNWFKGLRFVLTFVAVLALWTTFMCSFLLKSEVENRKDEDCSI